MGLEIQDPFSFSIFQVEYGHHDTTLTEPITISDFSLMRSLKDLFEREESSSGRRFLLEWYDVILKQLCKQPNA